MSTLYRAGETILGIAAQYGLQPETIMWANPAIERNPDRISIGDQLNILPINGVLHTVRSGDTLSSIGSKYKVDIEAILGYGFNEFGEETTSLTVGQELIIPGGEKPFSCSTSSGVQWSCTSKVRQRVQVILPGRQVARCHARILGWARCS